MDTTIPQTTDTANPPVYAIAPPLATVTLMVAGLPFPVLTLTLDRDDTEAQEPYAGLSNSGGAAVDITDPAALHAHVRQVEEYAAGVMRLADQLAALQAARGNQ